VGRRGIQIIIELLDVLAVIALAVGQTEQPLLQDRVLAVPQGERQAQALATVADAGDTVLAPAVGARARLAVREILPGLAVSAVVLAHGAPLPLAQIRPPQLPRGLALGIFGQTDALGRLDLACIWVTDVLHRHFGDQLEPLFRISVLTRDPPPAGVIDPRAPPLNPAFGSRCGGRPLP
jgi:hypothetical protein